MNGSDRAHLLTDTADLEALADEWRTLAERRGNAFVTPEWFMSWLQTFGAHWDPTVAVVRAPDGALRGLLPLVRSKSGRRKRIRNVLGDDFHPVAEADDDAAVALAAAPVLAPRANPHVVLSNVDSDSEWWRLLTQAAPVAMTAIERPEAEVPFVELGGLSWEQYLAGRSRQLRSQIGRKLRSLQREHDVSFRRTRRPEELPADLDVLYRLHDARWAGRQQDSTFAHPAIRSFHHAFATRALERGWLRLFVMSVDDAPVAALYGWSIGGRWSYYQAGFDPAWSRHSPGFLMLAETIREAVEEGCDVYDMLLGGEPFKLRFATSSRRVRTVVLVGRLAPVRPVAAVGARLRGPWRRLSHESRARAAMLRLADWLRIRR